MTLKQLASLYVLARRAKEHWTSEAERLNGELASALQTEGLDRITCEVDDNGTTNPVTVTLSDPRLFASVAQENIPQLKEWLTTIGAEGIIKDSVHPATLSATVADEVKRGRELPKFINTFYKPSLTVRGLSGSKAQ